MGIVANREELEQILSGLFDRVMGDPAIMENLAATEMVLRLRYTDPEGVVTVDLKSDPPSYRFNDEGQADVEMIQSADVSHEFWLGRLSAVRGIATGKISARGNIAKALKLLPAIKPAFAMYESVIREMGKAHLLPKEAAVRKKGLWTRVRQGLAPRGKGFDPGLAPRDTRPGTTESPSPELPSCPVDLPAEEAAFRVEMLRRMMLIRAFEESLAREWADGKIPTSAIHLSIGQEATAVGICFALKAQDAIATTHRGHGHMLAKGAMADRMMAEIYAKTDGLCRGKGGSMHVTDAAIGAIGANGIVGASPLLATGAALAFSLAGEERVATAFMGDGATNQGMFHEALNLAAVWKLPVLFVVENNLYGEFTAQSSHMAIGTICERAAAYGIPGHQVDGNDADAVLAQARTLVEQVRSGQGPVLLECLTYRWHGHMEGDPQDYRPAEEVEQWKARCPIKMLSERLSKEGIISSDDHGAFQKQATGEIDRALVFAGESPEPGPETLATDVFADDAALAEASSGEAMRTITVSEAINLALAEEMRRDPKVFLMGEDVALGGYMAVTTGLVEEFGPGRVRDTPISENAIVGSAVGAAMCGFRPVAEILFSDFITCAMDPIVNQAAKLRYMSGGQYRVPLVVRLPSGVGLAVAAQHSQSLEAMLMGIPGLIVAAPGCARDARALLKTAIRSENPVIFFEHKLCYLVEGEVPEAEEFLPFGKANVVKAGADVTLVSLLYTVHQAREAAEELAREGIEVEVIDLRTLAPLDTETVLRSVEKTGRLLTVEEGPVRGGWGAEVIARVVSAGLGPLRKPPVRLGAGDHPIPYNRNLENLSVPDTERIKDAVQKLMG